MLKYILFYLFLVSCNFSPKQVKIGVDDKVQTTSISQDTLITYNIEGVSTEGAESKVSYKNGKITKSTTHIYGETGQASIVYEFEETKIKVEEIKYSYSSDIENVMSENDMKLDYKVAYFIDYSGNLLGKSVSERIDIFKEFKDVVPFELK